MANNTTERLLLISHHNSYRIAPYIKAAISLGIEVTIASQGKHSLVTEVANGIHVNFDNIEESLDVILQEHKLTNFTGILGSDDQTVELAAFIAKALSLPHNPPLAAQYSTRKDLARAQLAINDCPVPTHLVINLDKPLKEQMVDIPWPCVIKPLTMSASRGVMRANNESDFITASERLKPILKTTSGDFECSHFLVEEYIDGTEIAFEGYLHNGLLEMITIFDKPDPLVGPFFEETIYVTPSSLDEVIQEDIKTVIQEACIAYGLTTGAIHAECRIDKNHTIWILEIATRTIGGDCARMLDNENFNIEELAISLAIGKPLSVSLPNQARGVMMIPVRQKGLLKRVEGLLNAGKVKNIEKIDIIISEGHELTPLPEGNQYLGYIFASGDTAEQVTASIREAYDALEFITTPVFEISK